MGDTNKLAFLNATAKAVIDTEVEAAFSVVWPAPGDSLAIANWTGDPELVISRLTDLVYEIHALQARSEKGAGTMPLRIIDPGPLGQPTPPTPTNEDAGLV